MSGRRSGRDSGFALPFVLAAMTLLSLTAIVALDRLDDLDRPLARLQEEVGLETAAFSAESRVTHLLLTEPIDQRGLKVGAARLDEHGTLSTSTGLGFVAPSMRTTATVPFDDRPFIVDGLAISVQDQAGLVNLNSGDEQAIGRALIAANVPVGASRRLAAALADYVDPDDLRRPQGAETRDYRRTDRRAARNAPLRTVAQATRSLGWDDRLGAADRRRFLELAAAMPVEQRFNLNTAPAATLAAVTGLEPRAVARLIEMRERGAIFSLQDIARLTGIRIAGGIAPIGGLPATRIRFTAWRPGAARPLAYRSVIHLGADADALPFDVEAAPLLPINLDWNRNPRRGDNRFLPESPTMLAAHVR